jgi:hypothetical protein
MESKLTTSNGVKELMLSSRSEQEWNDNCDQVKKANNGYPDFWFQTIIIGGILHQVQQTWSE